MSLHVDQAILTQLSGRPSDQVGSLIKDKGEVHIFTSSADSGVARNGGRIGSRFGPEAILTCFKRMARPINARTLAIEEVASAAFAGAPSFEKAQAMSAQSIERSLSDHRPRSIIHLGAGHDHIYCLLKALSFVPKIHVLNIDAHLDTRVDVHPHSGTPFRQFARDYKGRFRLTQIGIHSFANPDSNYSSLKADMRIIPLSEILEEEGALELEEEIELDDDELLLLSLDADAVNSGIMEGVSAVNHQGLAPEVVVKLFAMYRRLCRDRQMFVGVYEYNPLYDNLSQKGARFLASLLYQTLF